MTERRKILVLTSKTGGGHVSLAESLRDLLNGEYTLELLDPQSRFVHLHYRLVSRYALWLWATEFQLLDTPPKALIAHHVFTRLVAKELRKVLTRFQPDIIITTYPFLSFEVIQVQKQIGSSAPLVMLFADPNGVHASWLTERRAALTLAPTHETYTQALSVGFDPAHLNLVGWPVRHQFYESYDGQRTATFTKLGLDPARFTVFLQGGGEGAAQVGSTVKRVLATSSQLQVILAAGTNQRLLGRFKNVEHLYALPFTKEIAPFMAAADVIMGKAGPNMLFEAVALGKPFIATAYIPGQEQANLEFIRRHKLGWVAIAPETQSALLRKLVSDPTELQAMGATVETYRKWNSEANKEIVPLISSLIR